MTEITEEAIRRLLAADRTFIARFAQIDAAFALDDDGVSAIVPVPEVVRDTIRISNRMCRFTLDDEPETNFGTGFLVGPEHVLTAAHLFFNEDRSLIEAERHTRVRVEFETLMIGEFIAASRGVTEVRLAENWLMDPARDDNAMATRDVKDLDYAIVRLATDVGNQTLGSGYRRGWFEIPEPDAAPVVVAGTMVKIFQYVDRASLRQSLGWVTRISRDRSVVYYTASTLDAASGSAVLDDQSRLVAIHTGGPDDVGTSENRGIPLIRAAGVLEKLGIRGTVSPPFEESEEARRSSTRVFLSRRPT